MRFLITMHMPSREGNSVHQIHAGHDSESLDDFVETLCNNDFVIVEEFYRNQYDNQYYSRGKIAVNHRYVGKVKLYGEGKN